MDSYLIILIFWRYFLQIAKNKSEIIPPVVKLDQEQSTGQGGPARVA